MAQQNSKKNNERFDLAQQEPARLNIPDNQQSSVQTHISFSGPIPPPEILKGYEEIPAGGIADRIVQMAERQQEADNRHRDQERENAHRRIVRGQNFGVALGLAFICCISLTAIFKTPWPATAGIGAVGLLFSIPLFINRMGGSGRNSGTTPK